MVSGSLASVHHGEPRFTLDVDLAVQLQPAEIGVLASVCPPADYYVPPVEVAIAEVARPVRGHFIVIDLSSVAESRLLGQCRLECRRDMEV